MGLLRILLVIVLIYYAFSMFVKLIFKRKLQKLNRQMQTEYQDETPPSTNEVKNPHIDPNIGEYTEFEEIE